MKLKQMFFDEKKLYFAIFYLVFYKNKYSLLSDWFNRTNRRGPWWRLEFAVYRPISPLGVLKSELVLETS